MAVSGFTLSRSPRLYFGTGSRRNIPDAAASLGARAPLLVVTRSFAASPECEALADDLRSASRLAGIAEIHGEPSPEDVDSIVSSFAAAVPDLVIGVGGGSAIDAGKAVAAAFRLEGSIRSYLEGVGDTEPSGASLPYIAVPTTAGTGSEATKNAVLSEVAGEGGFKKSLRHENYVPDVAVVDPELAVSCPRHVTAASGLDALTQVLEAYTSTGASILTDALCESAFPAFARSFSRVLAEPADLSARSDLAYGAYVSGLVLANAGLGLVHGLASPLGAAAPIPHGLVCGSLLPPITRATIDGLESTDQPEAAASLEKYSRAAALLAGTPDPHALVDLLLAWRQEADLASFSEFGLEASTLRRIAAAPSHKNHPLRLDPEKIASILVSLL